MAKRIAALLTCALVLAAAPVSLAGGGGLRLSDAGLYRVSYSLDEAGKMTLKSIRLAEATSEIAAQPGAAFGVCCAEPPAGSPALQAGYAHPQADESARFWAVETGFVREGSVPQRFYGFVFAADSRPMAGAYAVNLYRADDGSLLARQLFRVVAPAPASGQTGQEPAPASGE